jgi:endo-1,3-1,4-beta-glycanase ExoK
MSFCGVPRALAAAAFAGMALLAAPCLAQTDAPKAGEAFLEPFDNLSKARWYISDGWTNGKHQNCFWSRKSVSVSDGSLHLTYLPSKIPDAPHLCGEVQTHARYGYGTYEARFRTDHRTSGLNAAFFTYIGPVHKQPHDEIDVEILTRAPGRMQVNTYVSGKPVNPPLVPIPAKADTTYQTFAFQWEPERIRWFVDGRMVYEMTDNIPVTPQKIYFSHWSTDTLTDWMGPFTTPDRPLIMMVDWLAFTPIGAACQFPESLLCQLP